MTLQGPVEIPAEEDFEQRPCEEPTAMNWTAVRAQKIRLPVRRGSAVKQIEEPSATDKSRRAEEPDGEGQEPTP